MIDKTHLRKILVSLVLYTLAQASVAQSLEVEVHKWTDGVDRETSQFKGIYVGSAPVRSIVLWTQMKGDAATLELLRRSGSGAVNIYHQWFSYDDDRLYPREQVKLEVGKRSELEKMGHEVAGTGFFRWRTWSSHSALTPGFWRVDVVDENGGALMCSHDRLYKECTYEIEIK